MGKFLADKYGYNFIEISAKPGKNIDEIFNILMKEMIEQKILMIDAKEKITDNSNQKSPLKKIIEFF